MQHLSPEQLAQYNNDGVLHVPGAIDQEWVERLTQVAVRNLEHPSTWVNDSATGSTSGRMFTDRYQWRENAEIRAFIFESGVAGLMAQVMNSREVRFYFDHLLIKEPSTDLATPWHQDIPYWPFDGKQIGSAWLALTAASVDESGMEFVRASHEDDVIYRPEVFGRQDADNPNASWTGLDGGKPVPDIDADREAFDIVSYNVEPGDLLLFSAWILHGAPGNRSTDKRRMAFSTRWLGDDAIWAPGVGTDPTVTADDVSIEPGNAPTDESRFPLVWPTTA